LHQLYAGYTGPIPKELMNEIALRKIVFICVLAVSLELGKESSFVIVVVVMFSGKLQNMYVET
jgi:hypothetical protein